MVRTSATNQTRTVAGLGSITVFLLLCNLLSRLFALSFDIVLNIRFLIIAMKEPDCEFTDRLFTCLFMPFSLCLHDIYPYIVYFF